MWSGFVQKSVNEDSFWYLRVLPRPLVQWFISRFIMVRKKPFYKMVKNSLENGFLETVSEETKKTREFSPCSLGLSQTEFLDS